MMDRKNTINVFQIFSISPVNQILKNNGLKKCHVKLYTGIPAVDRYADVYRQRPIYWLLADISVLPIRRSISVALPI